MLELGKVYRITMLEEDIEGPHEVVYPHRRVVDAQWPLVRLDDGVIINLASHHFMKAEPSESSV